ncbi:hypothetical protein [Nonomuraea sediminis]|uniref:hypothetical protein n=1 Tax=Nonomuraea sediminis TaxID=2835864 RepID=UPI001BDDB466|nr:hypothetical protein [Nonomuraea sediminis]
MSDSSPADVESAAHRIDSDEADADKRDVAVVADATAAPDPPEDPDGEDRGDPARAVQRELLWDSALATSRLDELLPHDLR